VLVEVKDRPSGPVASGPLVRLLPVVLVLWGFVGAYLLQLSIDRGGESRMRERALQELAYFPSGRFIRQAAIEYRELAADWVWLRAIQYYGYHLMTDRKYEWLGHVFGILTTLDPRFIGAYHFGAITLAWDARQPTEAIKMLYDGMKANPMTWQLPFDAAFINYMVARDYATAGELFDIASRLPGAWFITRRWAAVAVAKAGDYETARQMWVEMYNTTENKQLRALVVRQLQNLKLNEETDRLQAAVDKFREDRGRLPENLHELVREGYVDRVPPRDPFDGEYVLDGAKVRSTTPPSQRG
jgi:tetratricopeptide (TPR) repeat protein